MATKKPKVKEVDPRTAKWGTAEWLVAFPLSRMDRKRRVRAIKAVGAEAYGKLNEGPRACCLASRLSAVMKDGGIGLPAKDKAKLEAALNTVADYETAIYDAAFAGLLAKAWGIGE